MTLSTEAVLALAPDEASIKAARGLTAVGNWPLLGADESAVWGECKGSGAKPYQTQVDLAGPAFRCSCPSRKFPCKHGLALLLIRAQSPSAFGTAPALPWVNEWLVSRALKAQEKEERRSEKASAPVDPAASAEREAQRWQRIESAASELQLWLADRIAAGLGALNDETLRTWQTMAARMVDAQAPGLAQRVYEAAIEVRKGEDWPERTLHRLGLLHLACAALQRRSELGEALQADLRVIAGWPHEKSDVLARGERVQDRWTVLGCATEERDDKLLERRVWLLGQRSGRRAWLLDHAFGGRGFEQAWLPGTQADAEITYFPGASALRALAANIVAIQAPLTWPVSSMTDEWQSVAARIAACPWVSLHPLVISTAVPVSAGERVVAVTEGRALPLSLGVADTWRFMAVSGGHALNLAGEWDGRELRPLTAWRDGAAAPAWVRGLA